MSIVDKALDLDLVDTNSPFGFGQYVLDRYTSALQTSLRLPSSGATAHAPVADGRESHGGPVLLRSRSTAGHGVVVDRVSNAVEQRLTLRLVAAGAERLETTYRLLKGLRRVEIEQRLAKLATTEKESVYFVFPFALVEPAVEVELAGAVGGPAAPHVPGSAAHLAVMRHWISLRDSASTVAWSSDGAALAHLGNIPLPFPPFPPTFEPSRPGTIVSWAMNNVWDTNFPLTQGGEAAFRYAVASAAPTADGRQLGRRTGAELTRPFVGVLGAARSPNRLGASGSFCVLDRDDVEVVLLGASQRGHAFVVYLHSTARETVEVSVALPDLDVERVLAGTFLERELIDVTRDGGARLRLDPGDYVALAVDLVAR
ncbi:MAG: hypothetical protein H0W14_12985 [Actinobacteria bacterium]|nr:hypothetical protein [Actinomycetota bacterium]